MLVHIKDRPFAVIDLAHEINHKPEKLVVNYFYGALMNIFNKYSKQPPCIALDFD